MRASQLLYGDDFRLLGSGGQPDGRSGFHDLLFRREWPYFMAFDLLWVDGEDLRGLSLLQWKRRLQCV